MSEDELKARYPRMSEKTRRIFLRLAAIRKDIVALKSLIGRLEPGPLDPLLAKLGYRPIDRDRARFKKDELVRIIRDRLAMRRARN